METPQEDQFWNDCSLVHRVDGLRGGAPVLVGTALYPDDIVGSVESYEEVRGLSEEDAITATLNDFPHVPKGKDGIRSLLAYQAAHMHQLQF